MHVSILDCFRGAAQRQASPGRALSTVLAATVELRCQAATPACHAERKERDGHAHEAHGRMGSLQAYNIRLQADDVFDDATLLVCPAPSGGRFGRWLLFARVPAQHGQRVSLRGNWCARCELLCFRKFQAARCAKTQVCSLHADTFSPKYLAGAFIPGRALNVTLHTRSYISGLHEQLCPQSLPHRLHLLEQL